MLIIDLTYFTGLTYIANLNGSTQINTAIQSDLTQLINIKEPYYLTQLLGEDLYNEFLVGLQEDPIPAKWINLRDALRNSTLKTSFLANLIWYDYQLKTETKTSGEGEVTPTPAGYKVVENLDKMCFIYNEGIIQAVKAYDFLYENRETYSFSQSWTFEYINKFGL